VVQWLLESPIFGAFRPTSPHWKNGYWEDDAAKCLKAVAWCHKLTPSVAGILFDRGHGVSLYPLHSRHSVLCPSHKTDPHKSYHTFGRKAGKGVFSAICFGIKKNRTTPCKQSQHNSVFSCWNAERWKCTWKQGFTHSWERCGSRD